ncbi:MAG: sugar ABC transporter ATP-binding protein [Planctomycetota bacterium]
MATPFRLSMLDVVVAFGDSRVLDGASLQVEPGEVHALLGENGAGKSTLLKALSGLVPMQRGQIEIDGQPFRPTGPLDAARCGIAVIHQELSVVPHLEVADAIALSRHRSRFLLIDRRARDETARAALELVSHVDVPLRARVHSLSQAQRQIVEIARALQLDARLVVMDEPTSSLGRDDVERLFVVLDRLRERGIAVVYVSHFLAEVRRAASTATVLRDGRTVFRGSLAEVDDDGLVRHMAGRELDVRCERAASARKIGPVVLEVRDLCAVPLPRSASFDLHEGEVFGIGGLCGAGRTELVEALFALRPMRSGSIRLRGREIGGTPSARWRERLGIVVEDRKLEGLALAQSIASNVALPSLRRIGRSSFCRDRDLEALAEGPRERLQVKCSSLLQRVGELSGGNQQKVAFARLLAADSRVLLLDEPTRGIDVHSRAKLYRTVHELAANGAAILIVSSQLPELLSLCDRIAVMRGGRLTPARRTEEWTQETLLAEALQSASCDEVET